MGHGRTLPERPLRIALADVARRQENPEQPGCSRRFLCRSGISLNPSRMLNNPVKIQGWSHCTNILSSPVNQKKKKGKRF
jgi:hypothetical protein